MGRLDRRDRIADAPGLHQQGNQRRERLRLRRAARQDGPQRRLPLGLLALQQQHLGQAHRRRRRLREALHDIGELRARAVQVAPGQLDQAGQHAHRLGVAGLLAQLVQRRLRLVRVAGRQGGSHQRLPGVGLLRRQVQRVLQVR